MNKNNIKTPMDIARENGEPVSEYNDKAHVSILLDQFSRGEIDDVVLNDDGMYIGVKPND